MPAGCHHCGHPDVDHDDVCYHDSPEDRCVEHPDLAGPQCPCERYLPPVPAVPAGPASA
ncbi:hypothetical protein Athai_39340 [Actinocatenispora thailandica]|uniref:Uncharacterized protein n=1 Tax=Actinocatenispora thailandica TaxID=227318 RepID=A0A7R7DRJ8_9ACTN|nr:hypothetical protein [Actinocatenispora thailandica]BCJ36431.1 hypothetical protein Athai_39340 [Actinocatenispora thailandica]